MVLLSMKKNVSMTEMYQFEERVTRSIERVNGLLKGRFVALREEGKLSMAELVRKTGITEAHLYQWLRGDFLLEKWRTIKRVALVLGIKISVSR